ncbi:MAG: clostripain-related cysteine peptidase [Vulcanimicrobiota bacterium]
MQLQPANTRHWNLVGFLDARNHELDAPTTREAVDFFQHAPEQTAVSFQLARKTRSAGWQRTVGKLEKLVLPAAVVAVGAAAFTLGLPALVTAGLAVEAIGTGVMAWLDGNKRLQSVERNEAFHQEPAWKGVKSFDLNAQAAAGPTRLPETSRTEQPFNDFLGDKMKAYPARYTAMLVSGHGDGYRKVAGQKLEEVAETLAANRRQTGKKVDLVVLEACKMGNLEGLAKLAEGARLAIVSEDAIWDVGLPWKPILEKMDAGLDPEQLGRAIVATSGGVEHKGEVKIPQMALIDLEKLAGLCGSVEKLAAHLQDEIEGGHKEKVRAAFASTRHFPRAPEPRMKGLLGLGERLYNKVKRDIFYPDLGDLGGFLDGLDREFSDQKMRQVVAEVRQGLQTSVVSNQVHPSYEGQAHGLSLRMPSPIHFKAYYGKRTGLKEWSQVIDSMRPWRARFGSALLEGARSVYDRIRQ